MTAVSYKTAGSSDACIIFLHGVGSGKEGWESQIDSVLEANWQYIAIDAPGFGTTPLPRAPGFGPHTDAVLSVMDKLQIDRAVVCGHSLGGMTAQELHAHNPERISGLILSATSPAFGKPDGDFQKEFLRARLEPFENGMQMDEFARQFAPRLVGSAADDDALKAITTVLSSVSIEAYRLAMQTLVQFDQRANLSNIKVPCLLIAGEEDKNSPAPMMRKMASKIDGSNFVELTNTGHMAPIENASAFNAHLQEFLLKTMKP